MAVRSHASGGRPSGGGIRLPPRVRQVLAVVAIALPLVAAALEGPAPTRPTDRTAAVRPGVPERVFVLAGQSNAGGLGVAKELPPALRRPLPSLFLYYIRLGPDWSPLRPQPRVRPDLGMRRAFGPELSFLHALARAWPGEDLGVVKESKGDTSIVAWQRDWRGPAWREAMREVEHQPFGEAPRGPFYRALVDRIRRAVRHAAPDAEVCGVLWVQSERDAAYAEAARRYGQRLRALVRNLRHDLGIARLPFLFAEAHTGWFATVPWIRGNADVINAGMRRVDRITPRTRMVRVRDLPTHDGAHFDTSGQLELGRRFARAYLELADSPETGCASLGSDPPE